MSAFTEKQVEYPGGQRLGRPTFMVDDVPPGATRRKARGAGVRGRTGVFSEGDEHASADSGADSIRIRPSRKVGWGLDADAWGPNSWRVDARR